MKIEKTVDDDGWIHEELSSEDGLIVEKIDKRPDETISSRTVYQHDESKQCIGWTVEDGGAVVIRRFEIVANEGGEKILIERDGADIILRSCPWATYWPY